jgi:hypothetical protein
VYVQQIEILVWNEKPTDITHELRGYFTLKSLLHSGLKQVMSLFTLGGTRAVLVVALAYWVGTLQGNFV